MSKSLEDFFEGLDKSYFTIKNGEVFIDMARVKGLCLDIISGKKMGDKEAAKYILQKESLRWKTI